MHVHVQLALQVLDQILSAFDAADRDGCWCVVWEEAATQAQDPGGMQPPPRLESTVLADAVSDAICAVRDVAASSGACAFPAQLGPAATALH